MSIQLGNTPVPVKSSYSTGMNNCVMVTSSETVAVQVSDSKLIESPELEVSPEAWRQMILDIKAGH